MHITLNYGKGQLPLELPDRWDVTVIRKPPMPVLPDARDALAQALASPMGCGSLAEEASGKRTACILICDITRPVPNGLLLPAIIAQLLSAGINAENICVLVATGLHRPNEGKELEELVGDPWVLSTVKVENHYARRDEDHTFIGVTPRGTVVRLDRRFAEADLKIVTGLVEPHFMAGFSGGRKVIAPGIAHAETITTFHNFKFMSHPKADNCILEGNPLHEEQLAIVRMLGRVLAVNTVIDEHRQISYVNYGEVVESHLAAVEFIQAYARVSVSRRFPTVLTSAAGYPLDKTYYQTVKGMVSPVNILEPGGNLLIASECSEGIGSHEYAGAQGRLIGLGVDGFNAGIARKTHADIDEWQTQMQLKAMRAGAVHLYTTGLAPEDRSLTGVSMIDSLMASLTLCVESSPDRSLAVIPEGPYVVPVLA